MTLRGGGTISASQICVTWNKNFTMRHKYWCFGIGLLEAICNLDDDTNNNNASNALQATFFDISLVHNKRDLILGLDFNV